MHSRFIREVLMCQIFSYPIIYVTFPGCWCIFVCVCVCVCVSVFLKGHITIAVCIIGVSVPLSVYHYNPRVTQRKHKKKIHSLTHAQTDRQTDRQTGRQTDRQMDRQMDR